jgi:2-succinyl-5-enolpyruvyl-6-hydroxy-3-cyclohexene-1-carboxylate synthase
MTPLAVNDAIRRIGRIKKGLILAGKISSIQDQKSVLLFAEKTGFPVFADITSGLRLGCRHKNIIHYFDNLLANRQPLPAFDGIIHFGGRMTSKQCYDAMAALKLNEYLMILGHPLRSDPLHMVTARYNLTPGIFTDAILPHIRQHAGSKALLSLKKSSNLELKKMNKAFAQDILSEPGIAYLISRLIPGNEGLFLSNSMPVRNMDRFASPDGDQVLIGTNRGASGIDGIIASAAGFAEGIKRTTTLLIGDLAFLYDLNSLALLSSLTQKIIIVVINNNGGEIFLHLPIASDTKVFEKYFITPHGLSFAPMAAMFNLNYDSPFTASNFKEMYLKALQSKNSTIIEIKLKRGK